MSHQLRYEPGWGARMICTEQPGADCKLQGVGDCECESWTAKRDPDGTPYHEVRDDYTDEVLSRHEMEPTTECNVLLFLEDSGLDDSYVGAPASFDIVPEWQGDHYGWRFA